MSLPINQGFSYVPKIRISIPLVKSEVNSRFVILLVTLSVIIYSR